jgi:hypothetical protein
MTLHCHHTVQVLSGMMPNASYQMLYPGRRRSPPRGCLIIAGLRDGSCQSDAQKLGGRPLAQSVPAKIVPRVRN